MNDKKICLSILFFLLVSVFFSKNIVAQCDQAFIDNCSTNGGKDAKYIKHFRIRFAEAKNKKKLSEGKFFIMLSKGNHYRFLVCNDPSKPGQTIINLSNDFTDFGGNSSGGKEYKAFDFLCTKTGPYYLKMFFKDGLDGCGVCVVTLVTD